MNNDKRRRSAADETIKTEVTLSDSASAQFWEIARKSTVDSSGRTYADRMREKAERARGLR